MTHAITSTCVIRHGRVIVNEAVHHASAGALPAPEFMVHVYRTLGIAYPKFFKMDALSQLAFLTTELLLAPGDRERLRTEPVGVVLANASSSLDTDRKYSATAREGDGTMPSPALFVYTLPNVMIGELCIRHGWTGECACFVSRTYDADFLCSYVGDLLDRGAVRACVTGWVDVLGEAYESALCLVERGDRHNGTAGTPFDPATVLSVYHKD